MPSLTSVATTVHWSAGAVLYEPWQYEPPELGSQHTAMLVVGVRLA
ncbi:hypothetical protein ACF1AB_28185 [Streptomyces sp. NPDC014846]